MKDLLSVTGFASSMTLLVYGAKQEDTTKKTAYIALGALGALASAYLLLRTPRIPLGMQLKDNRLYIWGDVTNDRLVRAFKDHQNKFVHCTLLNCRLITDQAVAMLTQSPRITSLQVYNCPRITDNAFLKIFEKCAQLDHVWMNGVRVTKLSLEKLPGRVSTLRLGSLSLTDADLRVLVPKTSVKVLDLTDLPNVTSTGISQIKNLSHLLINAWPGLVLEDLFKLPVQYLQLTS